MVLFGIIVFVILAFLLCLLFRKLNIIIEYRNGKLKIIFRTLFFKYTLDDDRLRNFRNKKNKYTVKESENSEMTAETFLGKIEKAKRQYNDIKDIIEAVLDYADGKVEFSDIYIRSRFGTGDAAHTGMICGAIWTLIGNIYAFLCRFLNIEFPEVDLLPAFNEKVFEIEGEGIIRIRLVHIIMCGFKFLHLRKR